MKNINDQRIPYSSRWLYFADGTACVCYSIHFPSICILSCAVYSSVKTLLLERATVRLTETGEEKPVGALEGVCVCVCVCCTHGAVELLVHSVIIL